MFLGAVLNCISSLCNLGVLCVSVVNFAKNYFTTETQRTPSLHRESPNYDTTSFCAFCDFLWLKTFVLLCGSKGIPLALMEFLESPFLSP